MTNTLTTSKDMDSIFTMSDELDNEVQKAQEIKDKNLLFICGNPPYNNNTQNKNSVISKRTKNKVEQKPFDKILKLLDDYKQGLTGKNDKYALNNDYIKFIRFAHDKIITVGEGLIAIITPNSFLEKISFRVMREKLVQDFDEIYLIDLHGESGTRGDKISTEDQNVFDIQEGVCISYFIKNKDSKQDKAIVKYLSLEGSRLTKFDELSTMKMQDFNTLDWEILTPSVDNLYTFTNAELDYSNFEEEHFWSLDKIFSLSSIGIQSEQDEVVICSNEKNIKKLIDDFCTLSEELIKEKYPIKNTGSWNIAKAIQSCKNMISSHVTQISYRPFDIRHTYLSQKANSFLGRPRYNVMKHMLQENKGLCFCKTTTEDFTHSFMSKYPIEYKTAHRTVNSMFAPLYLYNNEIENEKTENFTIEFRKFIDDYYGTHYTPEQILYYIYAILHHQGYRDQYNEELKKAFAFIPFVQDKEIFLTLSSFGEKLALAHTDYTLPNNYKHQSQHVGVTTDFSIQSRELKIKDSKLYYNKSNYFDKVSQEVFDFKIGGYQVLKTLIVGSSKQPKTAMSSDEREHVETVISVLRYTIDTMKEIEKISLG